MTGKPPLTVCEADPAISLISRHRTPRAFGTEKRLDKVNRVIQTGDRVGIVGCNHTDKSIRLIVIVPQFRPVARAPHILRM